MSAITLSSAVRQNLLSLQSTADLLSATQNRLSTGKKVNSALDNPTNFFTAASLDARASDINNLLDGISNGVQILQAANSGITSLQKLVDSAKSIANQALQATTGYSTKSEATTTITGATAANLVPPDTPATVSGTAVASLDKTGALNTAAGGNFANNDTLVVNGKTITFLTGAASDSGYTTLANGDITVSLSSTTGGKLSDLLSAIHSITGGTADVASNIVTIPNASSDTTSSITLGGSALAKLGLSAGTTDPTSTKAGHKLTIGANNGSPAQTIILGGPNGVKTLDDLNTRLAASNMTATIENSTGKLTITTVNDYASYNLSSSLFTGSAIGPSGLLGTLAVNNAVPDANAQNTRNGYINQYNTVMDQIAKTALDASSNGVNLLNGDTLVLTFNETGKSKLSIQGVVFDPAGMGLSALRSGTDFLDNAAVNKVIANLNVASTTLRSQASAFGSNLSIVQIRQDFSKSLINVLQTGAGNLTLADTNEEAANSQALSTRQSIAVSALSLANQSQQSVLQLLR